MSEPRHFTQMQKLILLKKAGYKCEMCKVDLTFKNFHADHIVPYSLGGKTAVYNGQALCATCNLKKGNRQS